MVHKSRGDQRAINARKDPNKLARGTQIHRVRPKQDATAEELELAMNEYYDDLIMEAEDERATS